MGGRGASSGSAGSGGGKGENLYNKLKNGETLHLRNPNNGKVFDVQYQSRSGLPTYKISQNGRTVRGYSGQILNKSSAVDWLNGLHEIKR